MPLNSCSAQLPALVSRPVASLPLIAQVLDVIGAPERCCGNIATGEKGSGMGRAGHAAIACSTQSPLRCDVLPSSNSPG